MKAYTEEEVRKLLAADEAALEELRKNKYLVKAEIGQEGYRRKYMYHRLRIQEYRAKMKKFGIKN